MVEFTKTDFQILLVMTVALVFISFVFPAVGFSANAVNATDIPEFNASQGQFDYLNDEIPSPNEPTEGELTYIHNAETNEDNRQAWLERYDLGISMLNMGTPSNPDVEVNLVNQTAPSGSDIETAKINESEFVNLQNWGYEVSFSNLRFEDNNETVRVDWEVHQQPEADSIPIIGGLLSAGAEIGATIAWLTEIILVVTTNTVLTVTNVFLTLFNIMSFIFGFMFWLFSTYSGIVTGAPESWVAIFMAIPGVILSFEFAKLIILLISTILDGVPFT